MADTERFIIELVDKMSAPIKAQQEALSALEDHLKSASGGMGSFEQAASKSGDSIKGSALELNAYLEIAEKVLAVVEKIGHVVIEGFGLAIEATELKQDTLDSLEAFLGSQEAAASTYDQIKDMGHDIGLTIQEGSKMAQQLAAAGIDSQADLVASIRAIKSVSSVLGEGAGGKLENIFKRTAQTGQFKLEGKSLVGTGIKQADIEKQLSKQLGVVPAVVKAQMAAGKISASDGIRAIEEVINNGKIGELAKKQALDFGNQIATFKSNVLNLFADINTGPFLEAFHSLVELFDESTTSGQVLKSAITGIMDTLFSLATDAIPYVRIGFKLLENAGLRIYIFYKEFTAAHGELIDKIVLGFEAIGAVIGVAAGAWLAFQAVMIGGAVAIAVGVIAGIGWVVDQFIWLGQNIDEVLDLFSPTKTYEAAANWIGGLVQGIKDGAIKVYDAVANMAQGALDKFTGFFGIHSDSRVMMSMGSHLMGGLDKGIVANDTSPQAALQDSVQPTEPPASSGAAAGPRSAGNVSVTIGPGAIVINGASNVEQIRQVLPGELAAMFEQMGLSVGAA